MKHSRMTLAATLALTLLVSGCGGSHSAARTPSLYTNANAHGVWLHPEQHLGAQITVYGTVRAATRVRDGVVVALAAPGAPEVIGVRVYDRHFHPRADELLHVRGIVRGPLGAPDVPGVPLTSALTPGTTVIDAAAVSIASSVTTARVAGTPGGRRAAMER